MSNISACYYFLVYESVGEPVKVSDWKFLQ